MVLGFHHQTRAERTLHRYADEVCDVGRGRRGTTVRVNDGEPGDELQVDFGKMGRIPEEGGAGVGGHGLSDAVGVICALIRKPTISAAYGYISWTAFDELAPAV